ncbi:MAG: sugar-binding protein, partial [Bacteroidota bacterium]
QRWLGEPYTDEDFSGRYKLTWSEDFIYILAEIQDDTLIDIHEDGLDRYWDDDCLEIFIDEDHSGGNHQYSHNAFAYHIALDGKVVDIVGKGIVAVLMVSSRVVFIDKYFQAVVVPIAI